MKLAILADQHQQEEWQARKTNEVVAISWCHDFEELLKTKADVYLDLRIHHQTSEIENLLSTGGLLFINSVIQPLDGFSLTRGDSKLVRINAWPGFLKRDLTELAIANEKLRSEIGLVFDTLGWKFQLVPDIPGMITPRIVSMIINEAYFTLQDEVSTKEEIDLAMKLGTNYPMGPFEWGEKIGLSNVYELLLELSEIDPVYKPCPRMEIEIK